MAVEKAHILQRVMEMFIAEGIRSVRMDDIAQRLGVSKRTLYEMFGDREGLVYEAMLGYVRQAQEEHEALVAGAHDVLEELFLVLEHMVDHSTEARHVTENLRKFYPSVWDKMSVWNMAYHREKMRERLQKGIAEGLFRDDVNVELAISILYATSTALMGDSGIVIPDGMTEHDAFVQTLECFFRGISTPKGEALIERYRREYKFGK